MDLTAKWEETKELNTNICSRTLAGYRRKKREPCVELDHWSQDGSVHLISTQALTAEASEGSLHCYDNFSPFQNTLQGWKP